MHHLPNRRDAKAPVLGRLRRTVSAPSRACPFGEEEDVDAAGIQEYYASIASFYDLETASRGDLPFWEAIAEAWRPRVTLEYGCGTGRVAVPLALRAARWGGRVVGMDVSRAMLRRARRRWAREREDRPADSLLLLRGDMRRDTCGRAVDLILFADDPLTHLSRPEELAATFRRIREQLRPGGWLVVEASLLPQEARRPCRAMTTWSTDVIAAPAGPVEVRQERVIVPAEHRARVRCTYRERRSGARLAATYEAHYLELADLADLLGMAGCRLEERWQDFEFHPLTREAGMAVVTGTRLA